ncbi:MAG TPA: hypothetical protein VKI61_06175 [Chitinophagaceae bacterium]|jgi:hypothetical protein|nr:hypothetical protein [Chitinophagaceae bacterium]
MPIIFQKMSFIKDKTKYAEGFRKQSVAYIGKNTIADMKDRAKDAEGKE